MAKAAASLQSLAVEVRNSAAHGSLHLGMPAAVDVTQYLLHGPVRWVIRHSRYFGLPGPRKSTYVRHQILSHSLHRGCGLGTRLGRTAERASTVVQVIAFHFIDFAVARHLALNLLLLM